MQLLGLSGANAMFTAVPQVGNVNFKNMSNIFNDKTIGKTIKDLPENYTWDDIFKIGIGVPPGTQNMFRLYFRVPELLKSNPKEPETVHGNEAEKEVCGYFVSDNTGMTCKYCGHHVSKHHL